MISFLIFAIFFTKRSFCTV
uniref:Uncharacterized protein n=1 Tax=Rhizophora mucronata TaxID=61149 RepID=A0A2P2NR63_RHIMU